MSLNLSQVKQDFYKHISDANLPELEIVKTRSLITAFRGSIAHGLYVPNTDPNSTDDVDVMSIVVPEFDHYFGYEKFGSRCTFEHFEDHFDIVAYEANKFIYLLSQCNPNVLSLLWLKPEHYINLSYQGKFLINQRDKFATTDAVFNAFHGYAHQQFKKMTTGKYEGYMGSKRKALVDQYGYDTKNAAHLFRLLSMGGEYLSTGILNVERTHDRDELLAIKSGKYTLKEIKDRALDCFDWFEYQRDKSVLKNVPLTRKELSFISQETILGFLHDLGEF